MKHLKEDWERVHLTDSVIIKEMEYLEQEHFNYKEQKPAKIKVDIKKRKNSKIKK